MKTKSAKTAKSQLQKLAVATVAILFFLSILLPTSEGQTATAETTRGVAIVDVGSGMEIYGENQNKKMEMASTTKIFTLYFALEKCESAGIDTTKLNTIKSEWTGVEGSSIYLQEGEEVSLEELFHGLMLRSGNDSAVAIASIVFGSEEEYLAYAKKRLADMGYSGTALKNPHGLPAKGHHTTPLELAKFSAMAMKNPQFKKIVSQKSYRGNRTSYQNKNKMLTLVEGGNGIKTGYTKSAGRCLVSSCERCGRDVVVVTLNAQDMFPRSTALIETFFQSYEYISLDSHLEKHAIPLDIWGRTAQIELESKARELPVPKSSKIEIKIKTVESLPFFTKKGTYVGNIEVYANSKLIFSQKLYTQKTSNII